MPEKDFAVGAVGGGQGVPAGAVYAGNVPAGSIISKKPCYLVALESLTKTGKTTTKFFLALDKPELLQGFIGVKGYFVDETEDTIATNFSSIMNDTPKEAILDMMFPSAKVLQIRNLFFNANKPKSVIGQERK